MCPALYEMEGIDAILSFPALEFLSHTIKKNSSIIISKAESFFSSSKQKNVILRNHVAPNGLFNLKKNQVIVEITLENYTRQFN